MVISSQRNCNNSTKQKRGISLIEVSISTVLVGILMVASMSSVAAVIRTRNAKLEKIQGMQLAYEMMAEMQQVYYQDPQGMTGPLFGWGIDNGETVVNRSGFDDADDYYARSTSPPEKKNGTVMFQYTGWTRATTCSYVSPTTLLPSALPTGLKKVEVTVTAPSSKQYKLVGLRSDKGYGENQTPSATTTYQTQTQVELQIGTDTNQRMSSGVSHLNQPEVASP